jgi:hypothetical protein
LGSDVAPVPTVVVLLLLLLVAASSPARSLSFFLAIEGSGGDVDDVAPVFLFL